jgi:hypothetical protein
LHVKVHPVATAAAVAVAVNLIPHAPASTAWRAVAVVVLAVMVAVVVDLVAVVAVAAVVVALAAAVVAMVVAAVAVAVHLAANQHINNLPFDGRQ